MITILLATTLMFGCNKKSNDSDTGPTGPTAGETETDTTPSDFFNVDNGPRVQFYSDYIDKYCEVWDTCLGTTCDPIAASPDTGDSSCQFNQTAADACVAGTFVCDTANGTVNHPAECDDVCG